MDLKDVTQLLDSMPGTRSDYEFSNMVIEQDSSFHRQLKSVLLDKESKTSQYQEKKAALTLLKYKTSLIDDPLEKSMAESINAAREIRVRREILDLEKDLNQIDAWLGKHQLDDLKITAENFESGESEHWASQLGRQAAIELLADDKTSTKTMAKLTMLPLPDFKRAVQVISQFAEFIKHTTTKAEQQLFGTMPTQENKSSDQSKANVETKKHAITASDAGIDVNQTLFSNL